MNTKLYEDLKHCWHMGYRLPKIKEYCNTDHTIEDLQELFMDMWDNELVNTFGLGCGDYVQPVFDFTKLTDACNSPTVMVSSSDNGNGFIKLRRNKIKLFGGK